ncbi:MAG: hypothetical protein HYY20_11515 [Candidatus Tectomicrobia bacterium]|uniref:Uncharacterized protein n=1 Tax=Tectimicrobiota bacterium TaxID=2528274 RepID=A0A932CQP5_UNCTE|nr:hypothetical protein [Candidatus Tectomicrobia bacterium]
MLTMVARVLKITLGLIFISVGIVLIPLPVIPGWPLIFVGLALLGVESTWLKRLGQRIKEKWKTKRNC